jgi:hypothetical protein
MKNLIFLFLLSLASHFANGEVTGHAFLEGQTDHSGIKVKFSPYSPTAVLDSTYTIADGSYNILLQAGVYFVTLSKPGYQTFLYNDGNPVVITINSILESVTLLQGNLIYLSGNINDTLFPENTYIVVADVNVQPCNTLVIEPGTTINFESDLSMNIHGLLIAIGTDENKILFTSTQSNPNTFDWDYINFSEADNDTSILKHCIIEYGRHVFIESSCLSVENCELRYLYNSITCYLNSNVEIKNCYFHNYSESGVLVGGTSNVAIKDNIFEITAPYNSIFTGIYISGGNGLIENNLIYNPTNQNSDYIDGINLSGSNNIQISNNIIYNCGYGVNSSYINNATLINNIFANNIIYGLFISAFNTGSSWVVQSNIITGNTTGIKTVIDNQPVDISNNNVWNNIWNFDSEIPGIGYLMITNNNGDPCDPYYNISLDPFFVNSSILDFHVYDISPAIDAGNNDNVISAFDLDGNPRILDGNGDGNAIVDMGVYEVPVVFVPTSGFTNPGNMCVNANATIQYFGNSNNDATYFWDFDEGVITSGTGQGPYQVYWLEPGTKTISLYVFFEGQYSDTTYHNIEILPSPEQSGTPEGPTELCQGTQNVGYSTSGALYAESYQWYATPANAAINISGSTSTVIIDWNQNYYGLAHIYVYGINDCGNGIVSESLEVQLEQEATVTVNVNVSANPICIGDEVTFTATPINGGSSPDYLWQVNGFGVGSNDPVYITSELEDNDHVYCYLMSSEECVVQGWVLSNIILMDVYDYPYVTIEASPNDTVCITETITLNAGNPGCDYFWSTGETTQSIVVSNTSGPSGGIQTYFVEVIKGGICSGYDTISVYFDPCTGIEDLTAASGISIFPNPSNEDFYIQIKEIINPVSITLFTSQGILLEEFKFIPSEPNSPFKVDLVEYPNGIYFLKFQNEEIFEVRKIIKE